jgi:hypothetical protein
MTTEPEVQPEQTSSSEAKKVDTKKLVQDVDSAINHEQEAKKLVDLFILALLLVFIMYSVT